MHKKIEKKTEEKKTQSTDELKNQKQSDVWDDMINSMSDSSFIDSTVAATMKDLDKAKK